MKSFFLLMLIVLMRRLVVLFNLVLLMLLPQLRFSLITPLIVKRRFMRGDVRQNNIYLDIVNLFSPFSISSLLS